MSDIYYMCLYNVIYKQDIEGENVCIKIRLEILFIEMLDH